MQSPLGTAAMTIQDCGVDEMAEKMIYCGMLIKKLGLQLNVYMGIENVLGV